VRKPSVARTVRRAKRYATVQVSSFREEMA